MSYHVFFSFSSGLKKPIRVPAGTKEEILKHVAEVERVLMLKVEPVGEGNLKSYGPHCGGHWNTWGIQDKWKSIDDELLCKAVEDHNQWVRCIYDEFGYWSQFPYLSRKWKRDVKSRRQDLPYFAAGPDERYTKKPNSAEEITPKDAATFWHAFQTLSVPVERWSKDYYRSRMEHLYEVMRGRESDGVSFDAKPLSEKQAAAVVNIFSTYLDSHDLRLDCPKDRDQLKSSYDGGYEWCDK